MLLVSVAGAAPRQGCTNGHIVGASTAAVAGQDTIVVVLPSTMVASLGLAPAGLGAAAKAEETASEGLGAAEEKPSEGAPVGELATTLMPVAGVRQPRALCITGASPSAMFLIHLWV